MILFLVGLVLGMIAVVSLEVAVLLYVLRRLIRNTSKSSSSSVDSNSSPDLQQSLDLAYNKMGVVWVLESDKIPKNWLATKDLKKKKEFLEVSPVRKHAKIKDGALILIEPDASNTTIPLKGCIIQAVSASNLYSKKWAKRFPIRVENKTSVIYNVSSTIYIYLETSWEKESWCKALRLVSCDDKKRLEWFTKLSEDFRCYLASLNTGYPSFMKPSLGLIGEPIDKASKLDGSSSKVRHFWKKFSRRNSKPCLESKALYTSTLAREERKIVEKSHPSQDSVLGASFIKSGTPKIPNYFVEANEEPSSSAAFLRSGSQSHVSVTSDADSEDKFTVDEGTLCWNLLISRLFFDAKGNAGMKSSIQARIQRTLSNMRIPSYIGEVICTDIDIGNLPPYVHGLRVLPVDMNEVWAFDIEIEYSGGAVLDVETRLEVCELNAQKDIVGENLDSSSVGDVSSDLLEGFEYFGKQLNVSKGTIGGQDQKGDGDLKLDGLKNYKSMPASTSGSRWKSILNSIAKQVSQVPLSLSIRVASLRGTLRFHIKPPPSDQLWVSFTSMPDIEFELESSVGDHKITSGQIALFLIGRFKAAIRENMVLPNCETLCIPWMLAEKDDWVPQNVAPFIWRSQEANSDNTPACESFSSQAGESKAKMDATRALSMPQERSTNRSIQHSNSLQELNTPLLASDEPQESDESKKNIQEYQSPSWYSIQSEKQNYTSEEEDSRSKKTGRRARMLDLGKKMGEKLDEKRRHIEEKSRNIVERIRGP
ncbi:hypothetical protein Ddye_008608 [Dipteronia dyeriana]|uniref:SMP-LTD domain-containing protein n=1 Tax=Dipteronia dyeriana TaxID=168575 RepID=A0AAE0CLJ2_9ROSI|nr:hypothetical protein Ddye_008608 [Dipteronia dyeriana]